MTEKSQRCLAIMCGSITREGWRRLSKEIVDHIEFTPERSRMEEVLANVLDVVEAVMGPRGDNEFYKFIHRNEAINLREVSGLNHATAVLRRIDGYPELNLNNYDKSDVENLHYWCYELVKHAAEALKIIDDK